MFESLLRGQNARRREGGVGACGEGRGVREDAWDAPFPIVVERGVKDRVDVTEIFDNAECYQAFIGSLDLPMVTSTIKFDR